jgi:phosphoglycerol transferase MdoB-like AlkP superfamily enzyme
MIFQAIFAKRHIALLVGFSVMILLAIIDSLKFSYLHAHLYPWDFFVIGEIWTLLPTLNGSLFIVSILVLLLIPLLLYLLFILFKQKQTHIIQRFILFTLALSCLAVLTTAIPVSFVEKELDRLNIKWDHNENYEFNGLLFTLVLNMEPLLHLETPENYSRDTVHQIIEKYDLHTHQAMPMQPNVIMVMYEGFFDLTQLPVTYSKNPLEHLKALQHIHGESTLISPSYGGGTANTEFEVLTGLSLKHLPQGALPYQQYIEQDLPALPHIFKNQGYATLAIHPYDQYFFNREIVYPFLGFDDYMSLEDWYEPHYANKHYISEQDVTKKIISAAEKFTRPYFIFAITMQNHTPFTTPIYEDLTVVDDHLSEKAKNLLTHYAAGAHDADKSIQALVKHFEKSPHPTIIIFFGDHLPALTSVYDETQFFKKSDNPLAQNTVPALFWSNYKNIPPLNAVSTMYLGGYLLEQIGMTPPLQFKMLQQLRQEEPTPELLTDYQILQYDMLLGDQHFLTH